MRHEQPTAEITYFETLDVVETSGTQVASDAPNASEEAPAGTEEVPVQSEEPVTTDVPETSE